MYVCIYIYIYVCVSTKIILFQVLLYITYNSIKHQAFVYMQLNDQTALFQTIQFIISQEI